MLSIGENTDEALRGLRRDIIDMSERSSHVASALSCVDICAALYFGVLDVAPERAAGEPRDVFVLSKAHGCMALYAVLARAGFLDRDTLKTYARTGSILAEHPLADKVPGIVFGTGSLGHGLAVAGGMAKAFQFRGLSSRAFVLLGDGECDEGSVWEAAGLCATQELDNLTAIVDCNGLQACGECADISAKVSLPQCWAAFGWAVEETDGHDYDALQAVFRRPNPERQPRAVICHTVKGKGIDFMEGNLEYHYRPVRGEERDEACRRLSDA